MGEKRVWEGALGDRGDEAICEWLTEHERRGSRMRFTMEVVDDSTPPPSPMLRAYRALRAAYSELAELKSSRDIDFAHADYALQAMSATLYDIRRLMTDAEREQVK